MKKQMLNTSNKILVLGLFLSLIICDLSSGQQLNKGFEDIIELSMACRYADCSHTQESDCAVLAAITNGELSEERYTSYVKLRKESEHYEMSYLDKRKKDKEFGRFIKAVKKSK